MFNEVYEDEAQSKCEVSFRNGKVLCKVFLGKKLWNVFETNLKGLKKIVESCQKRDFSKFNML